MKVVPGRLLVSTALAVGLLSAPAIAQTDLETRVQELEQQLELLKRQLGAQIEQAQEAAAMADEKKGDSVTMKGPTPLWESADGKHKMELDGRIHFDTAIFGDEGEDAGYHSGTNFRRARLGVKGMSGDWKYEFILDAGDSTQSGGEDITLIDVANAAYTGFKPVTLTFGKHKTPNGFEELTSSNDIAFIERSMASNIPLAFSGKKVGVSARGATGGFYAAIGAAFGAEDDPTDTESTSIHGRVAYAPINSKNTSVHVGANGGQLIHDAGGVTCSYADRPEIRVDGGRTANLRVSGVDGCRFIGLEGAVTHGPMWAQGEFYSFGPEADDSALEDDASAFYVSAGYFLTGEHRRYDAKMAAFRGPEIKNKFSLSQGGMGAWELAARYTNVDLTDIELENAVEANNFTLGLNWYINSAVMMKFNYIMAQAEDAAGNETADFDALGIRLQVKW